MSKDKKNSTWLAIQYLASVIFAFVTIKLNIKHYGNELFGMWILFASFWGIGSAIDLGFGIAIVKFVAEAKSKNDKDAMNLLVSTGFFVFCFIGMIIILSGTLLAGIIYISNPVIVPEKYLMIAKYTFIILGINFYFQYISIYFKSVFEGNSNFVVSSRLILAYNILTLLWVISVSYFRLNLNLLSFGYAVSSLILAVLNIIFMNRYYPELKIKYSFIDFSQIKKIIKYSFSVQIASILGVAIDPIIKYIIGNMSSLSAIPYYEIARKFATAISGLFYTTFRTFLPKTSILTKTEEYTNFLNSEGAELARFGILYSGIVFGILSLIIVFIINVWFGFSEASLMFLILCLPESINNFGYSNYVFLMGTGKTGFLAFIQMINIVFITLSVILGYYIFHSALGLLGYFISVALVNILMFFFTRKYFGLPIKKYLTFVAFNKLVILNILLLVVVIIVYLNIISIYWMLFILSMISFIVFLPDVRELFRLQFSVSK